jgi:hypothetical protein
MYIVLPVSAALANLLAMYFYGKKQVKVAPIFAFANALILIVANVVAGQGWMVIPPLLNIAINIYNMRKA